MPKLAPQSKSSSPYGYSLAAAVNNDVVLSRCLAQSPDLHRFTTFKAYRGYTSAGRAYNDAIDDSNADVIVFAHQDVYFPAGFYDRLGSAVSEVERIDSNWAVIGLIGVSSEGQLGGEVWSSGIGRVVGESICQPVQADSIDEMVIVLRKASGVRFDAALPGYHLYGLDVVQTARSAGLSSWIVQLPAVHHSKPLLTLDHTYRRAWLYTRNKWRHQLPIRSLICDIEASPVHLWTKSLRMRWRSRNLRTRPEPDGSPVNIAVRLGWESDDEILAPKKS
jgi:hypothetical protein